MDHRNSPTASTSCATGTRNSTPVGSRAPRDRHRRRACFRSSVRSRWFRSASSARSSFRRKTAARSSSSCSIRSARRLAKTTQAVLAVERRIRTSPDIDADTAVAGAYAAPFGGFVSQGNAGQVHVWLKTDRRRSTDYWVDEFRREARKVAPGANPVVVPATGVGGGNAQPLDELVTDISGGDPTLREPSRKGSGEARPARATSSVRRKRSNRRWTSSSIGEGAGAQRHDRYRRDCRARGVRRCDRDAIRNGRRPRASPDHLSAQLQTSLSELAQRADPLEHRRIVHLGDFSHFVNRPGLAADHARRPQHGHPSQREHHGRRVALERAERVPGASKMHEAGTAAARTSSFARVRSVSKTSCSKRWSAWARRSCSRSCSCSC